MKRKIFQKQNNIKWTLIAYDIAIFLFSCWFMYIFYPANLVLSPRGIAFIFTVSFIPTFAFRFICKVYTQVWRYGGIQSYIKLLLSDALAFPFIYFIQHFFASEKVMFVRCFSAVCLNLLIALAVRMVYRYAYKFGNANSTFGKLLRFILKVFSFNKINPVTVSDNRKIKVAVIGAGTVGINLVDDLLLNANSAYQPVCFIDNNKNKIGREIHDLPVYEENDATLADLESNGVQEVIFTIPHTEADRRKALYDYYKKAGYKIKVYDYPTIENEAGNKRHLREFDPEELLFRKPLYVLGEKTVSYYKDKVILITGGGGSIGSELCRQIAKMGPKRIIILDVYENGAYDIQQELRILRKDLDIKVEITSVEKRDSLEKVFAEYRPEIVLHAAAHKHVPLMEKNCVEAVQNNVFGTLNTVEMCVKYGVQRMMMVSTDKAVNPTNVMGATKRMCEMIVQAYSASGTGTTFSATRFGNVLGSAGSVIPLFKKQIMYGGPVTITDKRIIRYFMTIPEASQLVLTSGAMANNGELFVLDMGQPVKIMDLATNMIQLSGMEPGVDIEIVETGLRPGEKLYEELLVKTEELDKTENELIFIERDKPITKDELLGKLELLKAAVETGDDEAVRKALKETVPTYKAPEDVNKTAEKSEEMKKTI